MELFNRTLRLAMDLVMAPLQGLSPSISLLVLSAAMGLLFLLVFRLTSNQAAIGSLRKRMAAHLLEFRLFQHSLGIQWSALSRMLLANFIYLRYAGRPLLLMLVPLSLVLVHLNQWYGYQPLKPEQTALVALKLAEEERRSLQGAAGDRRRLGSGGETPAHPSRPRGELERASPAAGSRSADVSL